MITGTRWRMVLIITLLGVAAGVAQGQEPEWPETVITRERPELDPLGLKRGGYWILPALTLEGSYSDNIFAVNTGAESDYIMRINPWADFKSDWTRNALNFFVEADIGRYRDHDTEDYEDYTIGIDGRIDIQSDDHVEGEVGHARKHVPRKSPNDNKGIVPTTFDVSSISALYTNNPGRFSFRLGGALDRRDYDDVAGKSGTINNDDQDRDELEVGAQVSYEMFEQHSPFVRIQYNDIDYRQNFDDNGLQRSSHGYDLQFGSELFLTGVVFGEVFLGYVQRNYDDPVLEDIDQPTGGGELTWLPSGLTTVNFSISQQISESIVDTSSGIVVTEGGIVVDHELLRNLLLNARLFTRNDDFRGIVREDDYQGVGVGARYLMNRNIYLSINYLSDARDSNTPGGANDYTNKVLQLSIHGQL
jgi:hypothetical protein